MGGDADMILYHATTPKKLSRYVSTGHIIKPVRGFHTLEAARYWADRHHRTIVLKIESNHAYKMPDHHNRHGEAWWSDECIFNWKEVPE
jgi:antibiotic biosynthesis monooxygenase (ABM) superfamily enzyme